MVHRVACMRLKKNEKKDAEKEKEKKRKKKNEGKRKRTECFHLFPCAAGYNNRAQALRLNGDTQGAMEDLEEAIRLSRNNPRSTKAHGQALCQRGILKRLDGNSEGALEDFKKAACLGSPFAKQMVVKMNPYAALCNQMLADVMQKMKDGEA